ncbi:DUF6230 family protein [Actinokineospora sp. HUAS TT18]|uniref:DUF6230 family protein n=1 Tax=Actinokineospora sp. HUAS TT18 TaxID=3447451 RepID=UPI003F51B1BC
MNGTRWGRSAVLGIPSLLVVLMLAFGVRTGVLASSVVIQSGTSDLATSGLYGIDFGLSVVDSTQKVRQADGSVVLRNVRLVRAGFAEGKLNELCIAVHQRIANLDYTIKLTGGDGNLATWEVDARNVELDGQLVGGTLTLDGVVKFGITGEDVTTIKNPDGTYVDNPLDANPSQHRWGADATFAEFTKVTGKVYAMEIVGPFTLPGLKVKVEAGKTLCPAPPAPTAPPS